MELKSSGRPHHDATSDQADVATAATGSCKKFCDSLSFDSATTSLSQTRNVTLDTLFLHAVRLCYNSKQLFRGTSGVESIGPPSVC